jgi:hypothetical protein
LIWRLAQCAWDVVDVGGSHNEVKRERLRQSDSEHLPFLRPDAEVGECRGGDGPGSGAVYKGGGLKGVGRGVDFDGALNGAHDANGSVGAEIDGGGADGGEESLSQVAGVEALLFQEDEAMSAGIQVGQKLGEGFGGELDRPWRGVRRESLQGAAGLEEHMDA